MSGEMRQVNRPSLPIWREEGCVHRERELLFGEGFFVQSEIGGVGYGFAEKDSYFGYVEIAGLGELSKATHVVSSRETHLYSAPDVKFGAPIGLSFGSRLNVTGTTGKFFNVGDGGYVPAGHVRVVTENWNDPASVAEVFLGAPYLWGGNSCWGIDCSGLVQVALTACGIDSPADSGDQLDTAGVSFGDNVAFERNDLIFWKGHVAMALNAQNLIHATAYHMAVVVEDIQEVIKRISDQGVGPFLAKRRP